MRTLLLSFSLVLFVVYASNTESPYNEFFELWATQHGKTYVNPAEKSVRLENFVASIQRIKELNAKTQERGRGATYGLNKFSDLTPEEFASTVLMTPFLGSPDLEKKENLLSIANIQAPDTFDWRNKGAVTAVKDQAQCGSCWAFSVTENIESMWILAKGLTNNTMEPLSPQQIVDCDDSDEGCNGGDPPTAYDYIKSAGGLEADKDYPYKAKDGKCAFKKSDVVATISSWKYACSSYEESTLKDNLVAWGPVSICVDARYWQDYQSGVMTAFECDWIVELDHCVQAVGYDMTASTPYWIVRNSWGTDWGEKGYILIEYGYNSCGLTTEASTAVI